MEKHILTISGALQAQVCSEGTWDEALEWLRLNNPAGTIGNWFKHDDEKDFQPVKCADHKNRTHYMFKC